jgi:hypothetical protein
MKYLMNVALGIVLLIFVYCLNIIYGNGLLGFVALMAFSFMDILVVIAANYGN